MSFPILLIFWYILKTFRDKVESSAVTSCNDSGVEGEGQNQNKHFCECFLFTRIVVSISLVLRALVNHVAISLVVLTHLCVRVNIKVERMYSFLC